MCFLLRQSRLHPLYPRAWRRSLCREDGKGKTDDDEKEMRIPVGRTSFSLNLNKQVTNC